MPCFARLDYDPAMRTLVVATTNQGKLREIRELLDGLPLDLKTLSDFAPIVAPEETGATFEDNAREKAAFYAKATGELVVAEDSGLEVDALGGAPGVQSARYGGDAATYPEKFSLIYKGLADAGVVTSAATSAARFVCALAVADPEAIVFEARGTIEGTIASEPRGAGGFGYDPIFYYPPFGCTLAEAGERKATVSHRGQAFRELRRALDVDRVGV
jgi:XTP/dITP diphosphohydrolase